jgi:hypothetical protein
MYGSHVKPFAFAIPQKDAWRRAGHQGAALNNSWPKRCGGRAWPDAGPCIRSCSSSRSWRASRGVSPCTPGDRTRLQ